MLSVLIIGTVICTFISGSHGDPCEFEQTDCLTAGAQRTFQEFIKGEYKGVPSSEPLYADTIIGDLPSVNYTLYNSTLTGLSSCMPELVKINSLLDPPVYNYNIACEHLNLAGVYEITGNIGSIFVEGKGDYEIDLYDHVFHGTGKLEPYVDAQAVHIRVQDYNLDFNTRGKVIFNFKNLFSGDEEKSAETHKYVNNNWKEVDKIIRRPIWQKFMDSFFENVNAYLKAAPIEHVFNNNPKV